MTTAFVLGGGGVRGAVHVGMLRALLEAGIRPDLVVGTSIGAVNGAALAAHPAADVVGRLTRAWTSPEAQAVYGDSWARQLRRLARHRTYLRSPRPLRTLVESLVGSQTQFSDLAVPLAVVTACVETASERWIDDGNVVDAVLASSSVPGVFPPALIDGKHHVDGGVVNSIPLGEAVRRGATEVFVLQVGRIEEPLTAPAHLRDVARISFELARRHRFFRELSDVPDGVTVHVLPSGGPQPGDERPGAYRRLGPALARIDAAYAATCDYLEGLT